MTTVPAYVPETEKTVAQLIQAFESDIEFDAHGFSARYGRSLARRELVRRGTEILPDIEQHLIQNPPSNKYDLDHAWLMVKEEISKA